MININKLKKFLYFKFKNDIIFIDLIDRIKFKKDIKFLDNIDSMEFIESGTFDIVIDNKLYLIKIDINSKNRFIVIEKKIQYKNKTYATIPLVIGNYEYNQFLRDLKFKKILKCQ